MDMQTIKRAEAQMKNVEGLTASVSIRDKATGLKHTFTPAKQPDVFDAAGVINAGIAHGFKLTHSRTDEIVQAAILKNGGVFDANSANGKQAARVTLALLGLLTDEPEGELSPEERELANQNGRA